MVFPWKAFFFSPEMIPFQDQIPTFLAFFRAFGFRLAVQFFGGGGVTLHLGRLDILIHFFGIFVWWLYATCHLLRESENSIDYRGSKLFENKWTNPNRGFMKKIFAQWIMREWYNHYLPINFPWNLVGGFNPFENMSQIGSSPQVGVNIKIVWDHQLGPRN